MIKKANTVWRRVKPGLYRPANSKKKGLICRSLLASPEKRWEVSWTGLIGSALHRVPTLAEAKRIYDRGW